MIGKPIHAVLSEAEPFVGPRGDLWFILHLFVELF